MTRMASKLIVSASATGIARKRGVARIFFPSEKIKRSRPLSGAPRSSISISLSSQYSGSWESSTVSFSLLRHGLELCLSKSITLQSPTSSKVPRKRSPDAVPAPADHQVVSYHMWQKLPGASDPPLGLSVKKWEANFSGSSLALARGSTMFSRLRRRLKVSSRLFTVRRLKFVTSNLWIEDRRHHADHRPGRRRPAR